MNKGSIAFEYFFYSIFYLFFKVNFNNIYVVKITFLSYTMRLYILLLIKIHSIINNVTVNFYIVIHSFAILFSEYYGYCSLII